MQRSKSAKILMSAAGVALGLIGTLLYMAPRVVAEANWEQWRDSERSVLLELFTSQGCSSCPPADALLKRLAEESEKRGVSLLPLSFHVDYWNRLGWTDPYSGKTATERQYEYARAFKSRNVYTPQVVVNGEVGLVGSKRAALLEEIAKQFGNGQDLVKFDVKLVPVQEQPSAQLSFKTPASGMLLRIAYVEREKTNPVPQGENAGSTLSHANVVTDFQTLALSATERSPKLIQLKRKPTPEQPIILFLQDSDSMRVLAAKKLQ